MGLQTSIKNEIEKSLEYQKKQRQSAVKATEKRGSLIESNIEEPRKQSVKEIPVPEIKQESPKHPQAKTVEVSNPIIRTNVEENKGEASAKLEENKLKPNNVEIKTDSPKSIFKD